MRIVLQKVKKAYVEVDNQTIAEIAEGVVLLLAIGKGDSERDAEYLVDKILKLRIFSDEGSESFMEKNIVDYGGSVLVVSQFTLYGDCTKGTRPSFTDSASAEDAKKMYAYFVRKMKESGLRVEVGEFQAHMEVELVNDGPVTLILESK
ncbi:MAG: D-tyrosyl-tRNA(Tyr) deacylase [Candidatus Magasanikbacteria bacterium]|nr:D-tyrosyl-tRNA(Tyr) deacylase [Candidatus Magasanikbacteria bacterium]